MVLKPPRHRTRHRTSRRLSLPVRRIIHPLTAFVEFTHVGVASGGVVGVAVEAGLEGAGFVGRIRGCGG